MENYLGSVLQLVSEVLQSLEKHLQVPRNRLLFQRGSIEGFIDGKVVEVLVRFPGESAELEQENGEEVERVQRVQNADLPFSLPNHDGEEDEETTEETGQKTLSVEGFELSLERLNLVVVGEKGEQNVRVVLLLQEVVPGLSEEELDQENLGLLQGQENELQVGENRLVLPAQLGHKQQVQAKLTQESRQHGDDYVDGIHAEKGETDVDQVQEVLEERGEEAQVKDVVPPVLEGKSEEKDQNCESNVLQKDQQVELFFALQVHLEELPLLVKVVSHALGVHPLEKGSAVVTDLQPRDADGAIFEAGKSVAQLHQFGQALCFFRDFRTEDLKVDLNFGTI